MRLVPATAKLARMEVVDRARFAEDLGAVVPEDWPPELARDAIEWFAQQLEADPGRVGWMGWYGVMLDSGDPVLGMGAGFLGPPQEGTIEVGYSVLPSFQRKRYATEMVGAIVDWALSHPEVRTVYAEVDATNEPSLRLLQRLGFRECGAGRDPGHIRLERPKG